MSNFTIERRQFILGAVLAPFASRFAAAGVKPRRSFTEYTIRFHNSDSEFHICLTEDGEVEKVTYGVREETFKMNAMPMQTMGDLRGRFWRIFTCSNGPHNASIRFRVDESAMITVDWVMASEVLDTTKLS